MWIRRALAASMVGNSRKVAAVRVVAFISDP